MRPLILIPLLLTALAQAKDATSAINYKAARQAYQAALRAESKKDFGAALADLREAVDLYPGNTLYLTALADLKAAVVQQYMQQGGEALSSGQVAQALALYRSALDLDPTNAFALQRLRDASARMPEGENLFLDVSRSGAVELTPKPGAESFRFSGDSRSLLEQICTAFGLQASFADDFNARALELNLENATFEQALQLGTQLGRAMWVAKSPTEIFFANDTPENHRNYDRTVTQTFYISDAATPAELNDVASALRGVFNIRYLVVNTDQRLLVLKGSQPVIAAAADFIHQLDMARPQVVFDVRAVEVSHDLMHQLGVTVPTQFQVINIPPSALALASQSSVLQAIQQLLSQGINSLTPAELQQLQMLENELQQIQGSALGQLLHEPFITFGKGQTLFAVAIPAAISGNLTFNSSYARTLQDVTLRASQGEEATLHIGERFPVLTSSFSLPTQGSVGLSSFPSFNYVDLGVELKAKPQVHILPPTAKSPARPTSVTVDLDLAITGLAASSFNGIPVISNREYKGVVDVNDGESALLMGSVEKSQVRSISGFPILGRIPVFGRLFSSKSTQGDDDSIMFVITPHIVNLPGSLETTWISVPRTAGQ